uniref:Uncharacterized protein n=1 Tax=Cyclophora tenuis TaxID=216820 RepID=A0A7S1D1K2_CYCTE
MAATPPPLRTTTANLDDNVNHFDDQDDHDHQNEVIYAEELRKLRRRRRRRRRHRRSVAQQYLGGIERGGDLVPLIEETSSVMTSDFSDSDDFDEEGLHNSKSRYWGEESDASSRTSDYFSFAAADGENSSDEYDQEVAELVKFATTSGSMTTSSSSPSSTTTTTTEERNEKDLLDFSTTNFSPSPHVPDDDGDEDNNNNSANNDFLSMGEVSELTSIWPTTTKTTITTSFLEKPYFTFRRRVSSNLRFETTVEARVGQETIQQRQHPQPHVGRVGFGGGGGGETMAQLVKRTLQKRKSGILTFSPEELEAIQLQDARIVFVLTQIHGVALTENEFGTMKASDLLHFSSRRPIVIDVELVDAENFAILLQQQEQQQQQYENGSFPE